MVPDCIQKDYHVGSSSVTYIRNSEIKNFTHVYIFRFDPILVLTHGIYNVYPTEMGLITQIIKNLSTPPRHWL